MDILDIELKRRSWLCFALSLVALPAFVVEVPRKHICGSVFRPNRCYATVRIHGGFKFPVEYRGRDRKRDHYAHLHSLWYELMIRGNHIANLRSNCPLRNVPNSVQTCHIV